MMERKALALFDFDGTLWPGDSILPYLLFARQKGVAPTGQLLRALGGYLVQAVDSSRTVWAKEQALSFIRGRSREEMDELARAFFREVLCRRFFIEGKAELERLKSQGKTILIVSASPDVYMRVLPAFLPVDEVIATQCVTDEHGAYTGALEANCKGAAKPELIRRFLAERGWEMDADASCAYGDSPSDRFMLQMTAHPVLVNPKDKARRACPGCACVRWHEETR